MNDTVRKQERIEWIDIFKAIAIILVVIGHATGLFNRYIYQFHVAAFFFISGYVSLLEKDNILFFVIKKIYVLFFPLLTMVVINALFMDVLYRKGFYTFLFGEYEYIGIFNIIKELFLTGNVYTWWLGAAWFIVALFYASILARILFFVSGENIILYMGYTVLLVAVGQCFVDKEVYIPRNILVIIVAHLFFAVGVVARKIISKVSFEFNNALCLAFFVTTSIVMVCLGKIPGVAMDFGGGVYNNLILNFISCMNGTIWLICLSRIVSNVKIDWLKQMLTKLGKKTLGILLLHFIAFKIVFVALFLVGKIQKSEISYITPTTEIGNAYWWLITICAILISYFVWSVLLKNMCFSFLLGNEIGHLERVKKYMDESEIIVKGSCVINRLFGKKANVILYLLFCICLTIAIGLLFLM